MESSRDPGEVTNRDPTQSDRPTYTAQTRAPGGGEGSEGGVHSQKSGFMEQEGRLRQWGVGVCGEEGMASHSDVLNISHAPDVMLNFLCIISMNPHSDLQGRCPHHIGFTDRKQTQISR